MPTVFYRSTFQIIDFYQLYHSLISCQADNVDADTMIKLMLILKDKWSVYCERAYINRHIFKHTSCSIVLADNYKRRQISK